MSFFRNITKIIRKLQGHIRNYHWGDPDVIPALLGLPNPERTPYAELWFGSHPQGPALVLPEREPLDRWLADHGLDPFPLLLKVIASRMPLSIQLHPGAEQARRDYEAGRLPDPHAKPEIFYALKDSWLLSGFRPPEEIGEVLESIPEWRVLREVWSPSEDGLRRLYRTIMTMPQEEVNALLSPLVSRLKRENPSDPDAPEYWFLVADRHFSTPERRDRGLFSILLLNLVHLKPGEALFTPPGRLHALLSGCGIELMRCSDNVVRGGLTFKPIDLERLLEMASYDWRPPYRVEAMPRDDFSHGYSSGGLVLFQMALPSQGRGFLPQGDKIGLVLKGHVAIGGLRIGRGDGFLILEDSGEVEVLALSETKLFYGMAS